MSATRPQLAPYPVIEDGDMSGDLVSQVTVIQKLSMISYEVVWSGTSPIGSIIVEGSNDYEANADGSVKNPGNWAALPLSTSTPIVGNSDSGMIDIFATSIYAIRLRYDRTSGTGTLNVVASGKVT